MSDYVGGYIFFEPEQTRAVLIAATLQAMELQAMLGHPSFTNRPSFRSAV